MTEAIRELLESRGRAMEPHEIADVLQMPLSDVEDALGALAEQARLVVTKKGRYALPAAVGLLGARTQVLRSGTLAARPLDGGDALIIEDASEYPMLDDLILVRPGARGCELVRITKRAHETFMAVISVAGRGLSADPVDPRLPRDIKLSGDPLGAKQGELAMLRVTRWPDMDGRLSARIERVLGGADDIKAQLRAIAAEHDLSEDFPEDALTEASAIPDRVSEQELSGRKDLRSLVLFTIDGEDAQDFDDAVSLTRAEGGFALGVHIADVSHYVKPGSPIDREALMRGTSVYLPGLTLPMLPEALCNRMCSLMPDVDRLAMSLVMEIQGGKVVDHVLSPSVIHSKARLTYEQVNLMLDGQESDVPEPLRGTLRDMVSLAKALRGVRHARGSIDFDMPEAAFTLDDEGRPTDVRARSRGEAERMIEDFMLLANETVAELAHTTELPLLYRVHEKPDSTRVRSLEAFLSGLGIKARLGAEPTPMKFQKVLTDTEGLPEAGLIRQVMLKSLRRAEYAPEPLGHFGLAARDYCHFTSPIRRYPDLTVHRMLKLLLSGAPFAGYERRMPGLAEQCSACEHAATLAERDADDLLKAHYMASRVGEEYAGIVTGVTAWGFYVTLENTVEGLVPIRTLRGDYQLDAERHTLRGPGNRTIRLGDQATIRVESVNLPLMQIDFSLVE